MACYIVNLTVNFALHLFRKSHEFRDSFKQQPKATLVYTSNLLNVYVHLYNSGPGSSVGLVTRCGLDGPGSNPGGDGIFRPSRPALGPTQPPVKWVPGLSRR